MSAASVGWGRGAVLLGLVGGALACSAAPAIGTTVELDLSLDPNEITKVIEPPTLIIQFMGYKSENIDPKGVGWTDPKAHVDLTFVLPGGADGSAVMTTIRTDGTGDEFTATLSVSPGRQSVVLHRAGDMGGELPPVERPAEVPPELGIDGGSPEAGPDAGVDADAGADVEHGEAACDGPAEKTDPPPVTCRDFCDHVQQQNCDPTGIGDCANVCAGLHWEMTGTALVGNTLSCRDFKVSVSFDPLYGTCKAALWSESACGTPCEVYCDAVQVNCPGALAPQPCLEACAAFTDLPCRINALVAAGLDTTAAAVKCTHATGPICQ